MGVPQADRHKLFDWSNRMIGSEDPEYAVAAEEAQTAAIEMFGYANELAVHKRANPCDDIISVLLQAEVDGERLSDLEFDLFFDAARGRRQRDDPQPDLARDAAR